MSAHTPGPWTVGEDGDVIWGAEWEGRKTFVASVPFNKDPRTEADARLIAAAPESHEANKLSLTVLCAIRAAGVLSHDTNILRDLDSAIGANRAAIAKATGEQS